MFKKEMATLILKMEASSKNNFAVSNIMVMEVFFLTDLLAYTVALGHTPQRV